MQDEILRKIIQIEQEESEFNRYIRNVKSEEEHEEQCVFQNEKLLYYKFEESQGDKELLNLLEQEEEILRNIQRARDDYICEIDEIQKQVNSKCRLEIEQLRRQLYRLGV